MDEHLISRLTGMFMHIQMFHYHLNAQSSGYDVLGLVLTLGIKHF